MAATIIVAGGLGILTGGAAADSRRQRKTAGRSEFLSGMKALVTGALVGFIALGLIGMLTIVLDVCSGGYETALLLAIPGALGQVLAAIAGIEQGRRPFKPLTDRLACVIAALFPVAMFVGGGLVWRC